MVMSCYTIGLVSTQHSDAFTGGRAGRALTAASSTCGVAVADAAVANGPGERRLLDETPSSHSGSSSPVAVPSWEADYDKLVGFGCSPNSVGQSKHTIEECEESCADDTDSYGFIYYDGKCYLKTIKCVID